MLRVLSLLLLLAGGLWAGPAFAQEGSPPIERLDAEHWQDWTGLEVAAADAAALPLSGAAAFRHPDGPRGFYKHGFRVLSDGTGDWRERYGVRMQVELPDDRAAALTVAIQTDGVHGPGEAIESQVSLRGAGWHTVILPWRAFGFEQARTSFLMYVKQMTVAVHLDGEGTGRAMLRDVCVVKAPATAIEAAVRGRAVPAGQAAEYAVTVSNCTDQPQAVSLAFARQGWEAMAASVAPATLSLPPGGSGVCTVRVQVPEKIPPGGHEEQTLQAVANGDAATAGTLAFTTAVELPHPYILHTPARWQEVREKVARYPWAKAAQDEYVQRAEKWRVPEIAQPPDNDPDDTMGPYLFRTDNEDGLMACGIAWQLTHNRAYVEKIALFLRRLSDPEQGYAKTWRGCHQGLVQEGHFFQHIAMAYDMALDSGVCTDADRRQIEAAFRVFLETMDQANSGGAINNWNLSEVTGAFYVSLVLQDLVSADRYFAGPGGIRDQLAKGTMDDGWWYECSISYNVWCASEFTQVALAYEPFGVNFKDAWVPASYSSSAMLSPELGGVQAAAADAQTRQRPFGMTPELFGPIRRPYRSIRDLWNGLLPFLDYRGVMFGVNDSTENQIAGNSAFELAYDVYRDPAYATIIKQGGGKRDLLFGVSALPENTPEHFRESAFADNVGLAMLRSQTPGRPIRDQIQAVLHYGTHGWAHGHFDRTDLLSLFRYGRSFWNPESVFYVYEPFMYKFYAQTSDNHNMVVVDEKMQEASPGRRILWHMGQLMQAAAVETTARWSNPPYGGMVYDYVPVKTFAEKTWREGRFVPIPGHPPQYGSLTGFTEPILQRRLLIVTDDYIVLADDLKGTQVHTFESLFQLKGFQGLDAPEKKFLRHDAQWNPDPLGSAQFVTDADWYSATAPAVARFVEKWGPGVDEEGSRSTGNAAGVLKLDVHSLWPPAQEIMVATAPEQHDVDKQLTYAVSGDGQTLAEGKFGAWILGQADIDVPIEGVKKLALETRVDHSKKPTLFWADARIVTRDGQEHTLQELAELSAAQRAALVSARNVVPGPARMDADYFGGPIKIAGTAHERGLPAEPKDASQPAVTTFDLERSRLDAVRFKAVLGSDYPPGPEEQRRKVYAIRSPAGTDTARFLTLIEPYEDRPVVQSAQAVSADRLRVELTDGRVQEVAITGLEGSGQELAVKLTESKDGRTVREEDTTPAP
jgi:hypothetical protein